MENYKLEKSASEKKENPFDSLIRRGATIENDRINENAKIIQFHFKEGVSTIRMLFNDPSGDDIIITNMTTLPDTEETRGYGSKAIQEIISWAKENNLTAIRAAQVMEYNESFWIKNGFTKDNEPNGCNDFIYNERVAENNS